MKIYIPFAAAVQAALTRDSIPVEVQHAIRGATLTVIPDGTNGAIITMALKGHNGQWHLASDCFEVVAEQKTTTRRKG